MVFAVVNASIRTFPPELARPHKPGLFSPRGNMIEPATKAAMVEAMRVSADVEVQLTDRDGCRPLLHVLNRAQREAASALAELTRVDAEDPKSIRALQNIWARYEALVGWLRDIVAAGIEADAVLSEEAQSDLAEHVLEDTDHLPAETDER
jgi:hypothetical protein